MANKKRLLEGFANRVEDVIYESGKTKVEIAKECDCERKTFINMADRSMNIVTLAKFCANMGVSSDYLLGLSTKRKQGE